MTKSKSFPCECCGRQTTGNGENDARICHQCYELAGYEITLSDYGQLTDDQTADSHRQYVQAIKNGGDEAKLRASFPAEILPPVGTVVTKKTVEGKTQMKGGLTLKKVNAALAERHPGVELVCEWGSHYRFAGEPVELCVDSRVMVLRLNQLDLWSWLKEADQLVEETREARR